MQIERLKPEEAAELMGVPAQFVRLGLQQRRFPWGYAVQGKKNYSYWINAKAFREKEGIT